MSEIKSSSTWEMKSEIGNGIRIEILDIVRFCCYEKVTEYLEIGTRHHSNKVILLAVQYNSLKAANLKLH